ncbi:MAG: lysylphosphatidylglycerol synthase transmembrane domain-containing protein [Pseudomonadota bacterium]
MPAYVKTCLRLLGATLLIVLIARQVELTELADVFASARWDGLLWSLATIMAVRLLMAWRLQLIGREFSVDTSYHASFAMLSTSSLAGFALPGGIAQDLVRGWQLNAFARDVRKALSIVLLDKYFGIIAILPIGVLALVFVGELIPPLVGWLLVVALLGSLLATAVAKRLGTRLIARFHPPAKLAQLIEVIGDNISPSASFVRLYGLSLVVQTLRCVAFIALFYAYSAGIAPLLAFVYVPVLVIVIIAPISLGGLGVREGLLLAMFLPLGADAERLVMIGFSHMIIELLSSLPGVWYAVRGIPDADAQAAAAESTSEAASS